MFEASVDGQPYDPDRWANYYKPAGFQGGSNAGTNAAADAPAAKSAPVSAAVLAEDEDDMPAPTAPVAAPSAEAKPSSQRAEDILAMIRNRKAQ